MAPQSQTWNHLQIQSRSTLLKVKILRTELKNQSQSLGKCKSLKMIEFQSIHTESVRQFTITSGPDYTVWTCTSLCAPDIKRWNAPI